MIIIIEGVDGSGKTTLANQLSRQTGFPIIHMSYPKTEAEKLLMMGEYMQLIKSAKNMILDRCWYSELAYGPVKRDKSYISYPQMYELERLIAQGGALLIHCTGPKNVLWKRCQTRGEEFMTCKDDFDAVYDNFVDIFNAPHYVPVMRYEYKEV